jgi:hypothetical protein
MSKVPAFHSTRPGEKVYHNNNKCMTGNNIEKKYLTSGDGGKVLCAECKKLNDEGK